MSDEMECDFSSKPKTNIKRPYWEWAVDTLSLLCRSNVPTVHSTFQPGMPWECIWESMLMNKSLKAYLMSWRPFTLVSSVWFVLQSLIYKFHQLSNNWLWSWSKFYLFVNNLLVSWSNFNSLGKNLIISWTFFNSVGNSLNIFLCNFN